MDAGTGERRKSGVVPASVFFLFWGMVICTVLFACLVFIIPPDSLETYRLYSNSFEVASALVCMVSCLYAYRAWSERIILVLAAFAFGGFALSNIYWYLYYLYSIAKYPGRVSVFFTIAELGFLGFMLFFIVAFRVEFPQKQRPLVSRAAITGLLLILALVVAGTLVLDGTTGMFMDIALVLFRLLVVALLIGSALYHRVNQYALLWPGICLWSCASVLYGFREVVVYGFRDVVPALFPGDLLTLTNPFLNLVGPLDILSFLVIQLGLFEYLNSRQD